MSREAIRFLKNAGIVKKLDWRIAGRLIILSVYGEEHIADKMYPITTELTFNYIAKRKLVNPLKLIELILTTLSITLDFIIDAAADDSFVKNLFLGLKSILIDSVLGIFKRISSPANTIIRPLKNLYQESKLKFFGIVSLFVAGIAGCFISGGYTLALGGSPFIIAGIKSLFGLNASTTTAAILSTSTETVIMAGITAKSASEITSTPPKTRAKNHLSRILFNSSSNADTFPLSKMDNSYVGKSYFGGDPDCPLTRMERVRSNITDHAELVSDTASRAENMAETVQNTATVIATGAMGITPTVPYSSNRLSSQLLLLQLQPAPLLQQRK